MAGQGLRNGRKADGTATSGQENGKETSTRADRAARKGIATLSRWGKVGKRRARQPAEYAATGAAGAMPGSAPFTRRAPRMGKNGSPPISRVLSRTLARAGQSFLSATRCRAAPAAYPGATRATSLHPYLALPRKGFTVPVLLPVLRWALTPPFHPCLIGLVRWLALSREPFLAPKRDAHKEDFAALRPRSPSAIGGLLSVALSVASRRPAVSRLPALRGPDFPRYASLSLRNATAWRTSAFIIN